MQLYQKENSDHKRARFCVCECACTCAQCKRGQKLSFGVYSQHYLSLNTSSPPFLRKEPFNDSFTDIPECFCHGALVFALRFYSGSPSQSCPSYNLCFLTNGPFGNYVNALSQYFFLSYFL